MGAIITYLVKKFGFDVIKQFIIWSYMFTYYGLLLLMWSTFFAAIFYFYDLLQSFMDKLTGVGVSPDTAMAKVFGIMNCIGLTSAFNDTKFIIISGLTFLVSRIAYANMLSFYQKILSMLNKA
jgi:hypothetical protein